MLVFVPGTLFCIWGMRRGSNARRSAWRRRDRILWKGGRAFQGHSRVQGVPQYKVISRPWCCARQFTSYTRSGSSNPRSFRLPTSDANPRPAEVWRQ